MKTCNKMETTKYRIVDTEKTMFYDNYTLTNLLTYMRGKKKGLYNKPEVYSILNELLNPYGVVVSGYTSLKDLEEINTNVFVGHASVDVNFPIENEIILKQMFGWKNSVVDVGLNGVSDEDCAYSFLYDLDNYSCTFFRHYYGSAENLGKFGSLEGLIKYIQNEL